MICALCMARKTYTALPSQAMPTVSLEEINAKIPVNEHLRICVQQCVEDVVHYGLYCPLYASLRETLLFQTYLLEVCLGMIGRYFATCYPAKVRV